MRHFATPHVTPYHSQHPVLMMLWCVACDHSTPLSPAALAAKFDKHRGVLAPVKEAKPLVDTSEYARRQYGNEYHLSWLRQVWLCATVLMRLQVRNKENYLMCVCIRQCLMTSWRV